MIYSTIVSTVFDVIFWVLLIGLSVAGITLITEKIKEYYGINTKKAVVILIGAIMGIWVFIFLAAFIGMTIAEAYVK